MRMKFCRRIDVERETSCRDEALKMIRLFELSPELGGGTGGSAVGEVED